MLTDSTSSRPLGLAERYLWQVDRLACLNCAVMVTLTGALEEAALREALDVIQREQPLFRTRITTDQKGRPRYAPDAAQPIPLRVDDCPAVEWSGDVAAGLSIPFPDGTAPLVRCMWLRDKGTSMVALVFHHAIADGRSVVYWMKRLIIRATHGRMDSPEPQEDRISEPLERGYARRFRGISGLWRLVWMLVRGTFSTLQEGGPTQIPSFRPVFTGKPAVHLLQLIFDQPTTSAFRSACRRFGVNTHAGLGAAQLLAVTELFSDQAASRGLALTSTVDLRKQISPPVPDQRTGVYFSMVQTTHRIGSESSFWAVAQSIRDQLTSSMGRGHAHLVWLAFGALTAAGPRALRYLLARMPPSTLLSHLGSLSVDDTGERVRVTAFSATVCPPPMVPAVMATTVFDGRLFANFSYNPSTLSDESAHILAERFQTIIQDIADNERLPA